jgi:hypothetical protein
MSRDTFNLLVQSIQNHPIFHNDSNNPQKAVHIQLACTLERLGCCGNGASVSKFARQWRIGTLYLNRVMTAIRSLKERYIRWPSQNEKQRIKNQFKTKFGFPGCIGAMDGTDVKFNTRPSIDGSSWFSRKKIYGFNIPLCCDDRHCITYYEVGWCASIHDSTVFRNTNIALKPELHFSEDEYLLCDSGYPLTEHTITPFRRPYGTNSDKEKFNHCHAYARVVIEHTNGILKQRWQSLDGLRTPMNNKGSLKFLCEWVETCIILHNFTILSGDDWSEYDDEFQIIPHRNYDIRDENATQRFLGETKRSSLKDYLVKKMFIK